MIDKVLPGQRVSAETTNKIIDVCNGLQTPSESFVNTPNGTLTPAPIYQSKYTYFPVPATILQAKYGPAMVMTTRGTVRGEDYYSQNEKSMTWFCFLGPDVMSLKDCLPASKNIDSIWLGNTEEMLFLEVTDEMLASLRPAGYYVDLAVYEDYAIALKEVHLSKSDDNTDPGKNVLVICGISLNNFNKILEDEKYSEYDTIYPVNTITFAKINNDQTAFQLPLKQLKSNIQFSITGDSQISALELSSSIVREVSSYTFIQLHEFNKNNSKPYGNISSDNVDILVRNSSSGKELQYVSLSSVMSNSSGDGKTPDADAFAQTGQKSIETLNNDYLQIYGFNRLPLNNDLTSYQYGIVARNEATREVEYLALSALSSDISADCLSGQGNLTSNVPIDCQKKLLKFDAGLSSNVEIDIVENNPGIVDVKIGVYYI